MKVYDSFLFSSELDLLELRLEEHNPFVDYFVLVQGDRTFTGEPRKIYPIKGVNQFKAFQHKIIEVVVPLSEKPKSPWDNERKQRDALLSALTLSKKDLVYLSDLDEIISRNYWPYLLQRAQTENFIGVWQQLFYYSLNLEVKESPWTRAKLCRANALLESKLSASEVRDLRSYPMTPFPCGWHFSYLMDPEEISKKISAFSHQEFNLPEFNDPKSIFAAIQMKRDLFGRDLKLRAVPINSSWPIGIQNKDKWRGYVTPVTPTEKAKYYISQLGSRIQSLDIKERLSASLKKTRLFSQDSPDANGFDNKTFNELISACPSGFSLSEWRKRIEFLNSVLSQLEGWFSPRQCGELYLQILKSMKKPGAVVEIGSWKGRSSVIASRAAALSNSKLFCVDTWEGNLGEGKNHPTVLEAQAFDVFKTFKRNVMMYGCDNVVICKGDSAEVARKWNYGPIDFLFIDASHDFASVLRVLKSWVPLLKPGAIICGDDWNFDELPNLDGSVREAFTEFFKTAIPNRGFVERLWIHQLR